MSFQEFGEKFFDEINNKQQGKGRNPRKQLEKFDNNSELKQEYQDENQIFGEIPQWLADKKGTQRKSSALHGDRDLKDDDSRFVGGEKKAETEDAILIDDSIHQEEDVWIPKSEFDEFESSGPKLSESKEEKAENIMGSRSQRAQRTDRRNAAPIAGSFEEWKSDPSETDLPGIDTLGSGSDDLDDLF